MQVVILAGGLGTRLKSVDPTKPKALMPVAGKPFIEHQFELLKQNGLKNVLLCIGHYGDQIEKHVGDGHSFGLNVSYAHENPNQLLGTGGALVHALPQLEDTFMMMYGDSYLPIDYQAVIAWFLNRSFPALMTVYRNEGQWDKSNVRAEADRVVFYSKKAKEGEADSIDYGLSIFTKSIIQAYAQEPMPLDLARIQGDLVLRGKLGAFIVKERFYEIGKPEGLSELEDFLKTKNERKT